MKVLDLFSGLNGWRDPFREAGHEVFVIDLDTRFDADAYLDMFGVPVCPHAGGVSLCELVQHLSVFDYLMVSASLEGRMIEYVDHLHEHVADPVIIRDGRYQVPQRPGYSSEMHAASVRHYAFPSGAEWSLGTGIRAEAEDVVIDGVQPVPQ